MVLKIVLHDAVIFPLILLAVLFASDGSAYGQLIFDNTTLIAIAGFIGNLLWVFGLLILILGVMAGSIAIFSSNKEIVDLASTCVHANKYTGVFWNLLGVICIVLLLEGGFWFTGLAWVVNSVGRCILIKTADAINEKQQESGPAL